MKKRNVLIFPAGTEVGLEIYHALNLCKEVKLFGAGQNVLNHARFLYSEYHELPTIHESKWVSSLNELCDKLEVDYIFPAYDDIIVALATHADEINAKIITAPLDSVLITRSKARTYEFLTGIVRVPEIFKTNFDSLKYPVLVKPDKGQGSSGVKIVANGFELKAAMDAVESPLVCEYLPGDEYTIDCFSDRDKGLLFCGARERRRTRNGISVNTISRNLPEVEEIARKISDAFHMRGAWFFQIKRAQNKELTLLEVAPRIAGAMACHRVQGVNFPLLSLFEEERLHISINKNDGVVELDRALCNRYKHTIKYSVIYFDFDDTLIINGKLNYDAVAFIFKCLNEGKKVILITRHKGDLNEILTQYRLRHVFDEIIHINQTDRKSNYINERDAIFIDDSFSERLDVQENCKIPTFDGSMLELLLNGLE